MCTTGSEITVTEEPTSVEECTFNSSGSSIDRREGSTIQEVSIAGTRDSDATQKQIGCDPEGSLMNTLLKATRTEEFAAVISDAWTPADNPASPGTFPELTHGELLLNAIPLSQKLLACMAAHAIDIHTAYACADLLGVLGLDEESAMLLRPPMVLEAVIRLFTSDREETRGAALRCMTTLITGSKEYCQVRASYHILT